LPIKVEETIIKKEKEKLEANNIYGCAQWNVYFGHKLLLSTCGWDVHRNIILEIIFQDELEEVFAKRQGYNGWKAKVGNKLTREKCLEVLKLYEIIYVHPSANGDYLMYS
jgi:hypothetical protein